MFSTTRSSHPSAYARLRRSTADLVRWLHARSFAFVPEHFNATEGMIAALGVTSIVLLAYLLRQPLLAWAAFAAFWTFLIDPGKSDRARLYCMIGFVVGGAILAGLVSYVAGFGPAYTAPVLFALVYLFGWSRYLRAYMAQVGVLMNVVVVVAAGSPNHLHRALALIGIFLSGGTFAIALYATMLLYRPSRVAHRALAAVIRALSDMALDLSATGDAESWNDERLPYLESEHRRAVRDAIELARQKMAAAQVDEHQLTAVIEACDSIFASLVALSHGFARCNEHDALAPLAQLQIALDDAARQMTRTKPDWRRVADTSAWLESRATEAGGLMARMLLAWSHGLRAIAKPAASSEKQTAIVQVSTGTISGRKLSETALHAFRLATVVVITFLVTKALGLAYAYWATMAVIVVMQPKADMSWPRMLERIVGSIAGALGAAAITLALTQPWQLLVLIFPLAAATIALRSVNYTLFVLFLTPLFVFVDDLVGPGLSAARDIALARAADNVLGSVLSLAGWMLIFAARGPRHFPALVASAIEANLNYAAMAMGPESSIAQVAAARRAAGLASNEAEAAMHRMILEGRRQRDHLDEARALLVALRRLAGASTLARLCNSPEKTDGAGAKAFRYARLAKSLSAVVRGKPVMIDNAMPPFLSDDVDVVVESVLAAHRKYVTVLVTQRA